tara:strand:+ start:484 stop:708 length:225 start_codon:yes stop_codon:yes gene_type:complete
MPAKSKSKKAKVKSEAKTQEAAKSYIVAKCQWCGMEWKHFGPQTPAHVCGKLCEEHLRTSLELKQEAAEIKARA